MTAPFSLIPVRPAELTVGKPLRWPVYDWHGNLLLASGVVIESQGQIDGLIENGFIHDARWDAESNRPSTSERPTGKNSVNARLADEPAPGKEIMMAMDDIRWHVGEMLYLQWLDNPLIRYSVRLIGFVRNKTVFVTPPVLDGKYEFIRENQTFIVRAFSGKKAYAFTASAVKSVHTPHPYLHLSYPKQVRCTIVRRGVRAEVKIIAAVSLGEPERMAAATITDLSTGGASGILKEPLGKKGDEGRIKFKVRAAETDEYLNLKMILRSVTPSEQGDGVRHGFEFMDISIHERLILSAFVHQTLAEAI